MNDELAQQMADALRENSETLRSLGQTQAVSIEMMKKLAQAQGVNVSGIKSFDAELKAAGESSKQSTLYQKAQNQALEKYLQAQQNLTNAVTSSVTSVKSLGSALLTTEKSLSKFGSGLASAGDAAWSLGKNFGLLGMAVGGLVKGATMAAEAALKQTDASLKATDELSALGAAGGLTAKEVLEMGHKAGLSSQNLEVFTKAANKAGSGLAGFGNTVTDGVKAFGQMTAVTKEQRMAFERMGISQERLMEMQGDYVKLQELSGKSLQGQAGDSAKLKKESLEYVENLTRLSAMTGKSADKLQKEQEARQMEYEELIQTRQEDDKIRELRAQGRNKEADSLELEQKKRQEYLREVEAVYGRDMAMKVGRVARTGGYDKQTAGLAVLGLDAGKIQQDISGAKDLDEARRNAAARNQEIKGLQSESLKSFGTALQYGGEDLGKRLGVTGESLRESGKFMGRDEVAAYEASKRQTGAPSTGKTSDTVAKDPAQVFRNEMTEAGISARKKVDEIVLAMNPMMSGFNSTTIAATALTAAAVAAAAALASMAAKAKLGDLLDKAGTPNKGGRTRDSKGRFTKAPVGGASKLGGLVKGLGGLGNLAKGAAGGIAGLAGGIALDYGASKAEAAGHTKTAAGLDTASTALKWGGTGAMIGSVVPGVGTAIGGGLGALAGGAYGMYQNWGKMFGGKTENPATDVASAKAAKDAETAKLEADKNQTKATSNLDVNTKENNRQLDINTKALLDLTDALNDLTIVTSAKTASGSPEQIQKMLEGIYNKRGIGSGTPATAGTTGGVSGGGSSSGSSGGGTSSSGGGSSGSSSSGGGSSSSSSSGGGSSPPVGGGTSTAGPSKAGTRGLDVILGDEVRKGGTVSWRTNNPGNISYADITKKHGALAPFINPNGDAQQRSVGIAIMPTLEAGENAQMDLWRRPSYNNLTIDAAVNRWTGQHSGLGSTYAKDLAKAAGVDLNTTVRDLKDDQLRNLVKKQAIWEGFKPGKIEKARNGGVFEGPDTGYLVELHGNEMVAPTEKFRQLLDNMQQVTKQDLGTVTNTTSTATATTSSAADPAMIADMMEMMETKFNDIIDALNEGNGISDKILTYSKV